MSLWENQNLQHFNIGSSLLELSRHAVNNGLYVPTQLTLLAKTLLQMDEIGKILDPTFDPQASIRRNASVLMMQRFRKSLSQGNIFNSLLDLKRFAAGLPARLNRLLDLFTGPDLELKIRVVDAKGDRHERVSENRQPHHRR